MHATLFSYSDNRVILLISFALFHSIRIFNAFSWNHIQNKTIILSAIFELMTFAKKKKCILLAEKKYTFLNLRLWCTSSFLACLISLFNKVTIPMWTIFITLWRHYHFFVIVIYGSFYPLKNYSRQTERLFLNVNSTSNSNWSRRHTASILSWQHLKML